MSIERKRARDTILGVLVADAASAGLHWIYDVAEVRAKGGETPEFTDPASNAYHSRRRIGQFTHYGDHARLALESVADRGEFDAEDFTRRFVARFGAEDYDGYLDHATEDLLASGAAADDNQTGAFAKLAVLAARYRNDPEFDARIEAAIKTTHDNAQAVRYGLAAARGIRAAILGADPAAVVEEVCASAGATGALCRKAVAATPGDHIEFAVATGQDCPAPHALPVALHGVLLGGGFEVVVRQGILAGGDSAGRLLVTAAIRGATDGVPGAWLDRVEGHGELEALTDRLLGPNQ